MTIDLLQLYTFTSIQVDNFRRAARHGRKDEARDFLRYVRNSRILELLKQGDFKNFQVDVPHLEWQMRELENDCHPTTQSDHKDDFTAILATLERLAVGIQLLLKQNQTPKL